MKVTLIDYTGAGAPDPASYAAGLLIFTKNTRLEMDLTSVEKYQNAPKYSQETELAYMANTIPSSWEFVDYTFMIQDVTRAFTHQLVRTRTASFAQQTMRVLNVNGWGYGAGPSIKDDMLRNQMYNDTMESIAKSYDDLIDEGAAIEDARGVLPTNIHTNIVMKANLRTMAEMVTKRSSPRTQGEYRDFIEAVKVEMIRVHPWVRLFLERDFNRAAKDLDEMIQKLPDNIASEYKTNMIKLVDQMRKG